MILEAIDKRLPSEILAEKRAQINSSSENAVNRLADARLLSGAENTSVKLDLIDLNGQTKQVTLLRKSFNSTSLTAPQFSARRVPSGIGYIRFNEFNDSMTKRYKKSLADLKDTRRLIIDWRFNHGGSQYAPEEIAASLLTEKRFLSALPKRAAEKCRSFSASL